MESVFVVTALVGACQFFKSIAGRPIPAWAKIAASVVIGGVAGYFGVDNLTVESGIISGLAASGVYTVAQKV